MLKQNLNRKFLNKFTEEIIFILKTDFEQKEHEQRDFARIKQVVETEKLKQKFSGYEALPIITLPPKQIQQPTLQHPAQVTQTQQQTTIKKQVPIKQLPQKISLPVQLQVAPGEINLGKISFLLKDPLVTYVECPGENKIIVVKKAGAITKTQIILTKTEILDIISSFSAKARIPLIEGMLNARVENLEISAIVSEVSSPSFILKKSLINVIPTEPSILERGMMQFQSQIQQTPVMPPINRPFAPGANFLQPPIRPQQQINQQRQQSVNQQPQQQESFWNKKIKIGK